MAFNPTLKHLTTRLDGGVIWTASTEYLADNIVIFQNASYRCLINHTSSASFVTDLNSNRWVKLNDEINYILNGNALVDTSGWSTYADAAAAQPVDGAGGSPNVTFTRSTTTPLRGIADFNFAKDAANRQGQGVSTDFTIDSADQAKVLTVTFDYEVLSGTYADGDLTVYLIADPSGTPVVIQPAGYTIQSATSGTKMREIATFQTQASGQSYRLCLHVASTSAQAYTIAIDNVSVSPQKVVYGSPVTDWVSYTPSFQTVSNPQPVLGNGTITGRYRRVGDSLEVQVTLEVGSTTTFGTGSFRFTIPSFAQIDNSKLSNSNGKATVGEAYLYDSSTNLTYVITAASASGGNTTTFELVSNQGNTVANGTPISFANNDFIAARALLPIAGLSSSVQMSNDTDTRVNAFIVQKTTSQTFATSGVTAKITNWDTTPERNDGFTWDAVNGDLTVPVSGVYAICANIGWSSGGGARLTYINAAGAYQQITSVAAASGVNAIVPAYAIVELKAGQTISVQGRQDSGGSLGTSTLNDETKLHVFRLSGPATIAASETVAASYWLPANQTSDSSTPLNFSSKEFDSHNAVTTGAAWRFSAPISGTYLVTGFVFQNTLIVSGLLVYKNGSAYKAFGYGNGSSYSANGSVEIKLNAGDYIDLRASASSSYSGAASLNSTGASHIDICRVGN
jgi:hypothetical protein